ncbi:MAG: glutaredoxin [Linnemannia gamsii]|nr:thioredoxin reductase [Mortierella sp. AD032]KAK3839939.1 MAG: glutaredoxin [Linnemannia gamsii]
MASHLAASSIRTLIKTSIASNAVMIFSKSYCPYCLRVKDLFDDLNVPYKALELDEHDQGPQIQNDLKTLTGQTSVPNVFVKGTHVGGSDDTHLARDGGRLKELLDRKVWETPYPDA